MKPVSVTRYYGLWERLMRLALAGIIRLWAAVLNARIRMARSMAAQQAAKDAAKAYARRHMYPSNTGVPMMTDPTYGRVTRSAQWLVQDALGSSTDVALRVAMENRIMQRQNYGR